jgi:hypothetical protein
MKGSPPRSVRVGIVISGQLVEERVLDAATPVTFGQSLRCALSVPLDGLPREHVLFARDQGRLLLRVPTGMTGRISRGDARVDVTPGDIALERGVRGKLEIGDATILFQDIARPAPTPRMALPPSLRQTFVDRVDRRLALFVGGSLALHIGLGVYAWTHDVEQRSFGTPTVATTYQQDVIDILVPDPVTPPTTTEPGVATPAPAHTPHRIVEPTRITTRPSQPIDSQRLASILTGGDGEVGKAGMNPRQPGADLDKQIDDARDAHATIGDGTHTSRANDDASVITRDGPITHVDPTLTHVPDTHRDDLYIRINPGDVKPETSTTLTAATVLDRITTVYMAGLQRCYRLGLATDSKLAGRVRVSFTVDERGKVIDPDATGLSSEVDGCISRQMQNWRFPIPKDGDGDATDASFTVSLALQPS